MYFLEDVEGVLKARDRIEITDSQYEALKKLYEMVDAYDDLIDRPDNDEGIVNDPRWHKIREYAKQVYKKLTNSWTRCKRFFDSNVEKNFLTIISF